MLPGEALDLRQRVIDALRIERPPALEERILVTEVAVLRAAARDDERVGNQIAPPLDEIAPDRREAIERAARGRSIHGRRMAGTQVREEQGEGLLTRPEKDRV